MARSRKRREFKPMDEDSKVTEDRFRFPMDLDEGNTERVARQSRATDDFAVKDRTGEHHFSTRLPKDDNSGYILKKAREIPSAIHGLRKPQNKDNGTDTGKREDDRDVYEDDTDYDEISSVIIRDIVRERNRKKARDQRRKNAAAKERTAQAEAKENYNLKSAAKPLGKKKIPLQDEKIPTKTMGTDIKHNNKASEKRYGPTQSLPSLNMLGKMQANDYMQEDPELSESVIQAFQANGIPASIHNYRSNGIIGTHELKLDRNFRISNIEKLKEYLLPYLPGENLRISAPIIGTSHIGLEIPLREPRPAYISTLFQKSSLKLRKNDYKFTLGKIVDDQIFSYELPKAGHLLVYGGSDDEAVHLVDNFLISMLMNHTPHDLKLKFVSGDDRYEDYNQLPHLFSDHSNIRSDESLKDVLEEANARQNQFRRAHVRNITSFNQRVSHANQKSVIVVIIDDFSELLQTTNTDTMSVIMQLLKKGKPLGIHLIVRHSDRRVKIRYEIVQMLHMRISFKDEKNLIINGAEHLIEGNDTLIQIPTSNKSLRVNRGEIERDTKNSILRFIREQQS